jgi:hypothetical protein
LPVGILGINNKQGQKQKEKDRSQGVHLSLFFYKHNGLLGRILLDRL